MVALHQPANGNMEMVLTGTHCLPVNDSGKSAHSSDELGRSPFHKDHDRIIFSGAFRRLGRKTQVHPVSSNDHIHTRLTHSLVSCVGRSLGMRVGEVLRDDLPEWCSPPISA